MNNLYKSEKYARLETLGMGPYAMKKLKVCPECGQITGARVFFCPGCRSLLRQKTLFDLYKKMHSCCTHCKEPLADDAKYCPHCGKQV